MDYIKTLISKVVDIEGNAAEDAEILKNFERVSLIKDFTKEEKELVFKDEINEIKDYDVKIITLKILENLPENFWYKPNISEYGETRREDEGVGGNILHTKRAFKIADDLAGMWKISDYQRDIVLAATLIHDAFLDNFLGENSSKDEIFHIHLIQPRIKFINYQYLINSSKNKDVFDLIMKGVEGHTGECCLIPSLRYKDEDDFLKIVHLADYFANKKEG